MRSAPGARRGGGADADSSEDVAGVQAECAVRVARGGRRRPRGAHGGRARRFRPQPDRDAARQDAVRPERRRLRRAAAGLPERHPHPSRRLRLPPRRLRRDRADAGSRVLAEPDVQLRPLVTVLRADDGVLPGHSGAGVHPEPRLHRPDGDQRGAAEPAHQRVPGRQRLLRLVRRRHRLRHRGCRRCRGRRHHLARVRACDAGRAVRLAVPVQRHGGRRRGLRRLLGGDDVAARSTAGSTCRASPNGDAGLPPDAPIAASAASTST